MTDRPAPKRPNADMIAVERDYRTGILSNREIARTYGCTETAVRKWAKQHGWTRDLEARVASAIANQAIRDTASAHLDAQPVRTEQVRTEVRTPPVRSEVRSGPVRTSQIAIPDNPPPRPADKYTDQQIVEGFAAAGAAAILKHREDLNRLRDRRDKLMRLWDRAIAKRVDAVVIDQDGVAVEADVPLEDIALGMSIIDANSRIDERIAKMERQALQIDRQQDQEAPPDPEADAKREASRQLAYRILADMARRVAPAEPLTIDGLPGEPGEGQERG